MEFLEDGHLELYNLRDDIGERTTWPPLIPRRPSSFTPSSPTGARGSRPRCLNRGGKRQNRPATGKKAAGKAGRKRRPSPETPELVSHYRSAIELANSPADPIDW